MAAYVGRRLIFSVFVLLGAATVIFIIIRAVPGNPAQVLLGPNATPAEVAALAQKLGLNLPLPVQ
jgi:peptide/nickel transport system permease protein